MRWFRKKKPADSSRDGEGMLRAMKTEHHVDCNDDERFPIIEAFAELLWSRFACDSSVKIERYQWWSENSGNLHAPGIWVTRFFEGRQSERRYLPLAWLGGSEAAELAFGVIYRRCGLDKWKCEETSDYKIRIVTDKGKCVGEWPSGKCSLNEAVVRALVLAEKNRYKHSFDDL